MTAYWVELSEAEGKPVRELGHTRVTCSPLPYSLPLPGMSAVRWAVTVIASTVVMQMCPPCCCPLRDGQKQGLPCC